MPAYPMQHHPDTAAHHAPTLTAKNIERAYQRPEMDLYKKIALYGAHHARELEYYLASPEGRLVKSIISDRIMVMLAQQAEANFEARETQSLHRRILSFLMMRYLLEKERREHRKRTEVEQIIEAQLHDSPPQETNQPIPIPSPIIIDTRLAFDEMEQWLQEEMEHLDASMKELALEIKRMRDLEETLEKGLEDLINAPEELENTGEKIADFFMACAQQFTEALEGNMPTIDPQAASQQPTLPQQNKQPLHQPNPLRASHDQELHKLQEKQEITSKKLDLVQQLRDTVKQQTQQFSAPEFRQQLRDTVHQSSKQLLEVIRTHRMEAEREGMTLYDRQARITTEKTQVSADKQDIMSRYNEAARRLQTQPTTADLSPSTTPTPLRTTPRPMK